MSEKTKIPWCDATASPWNGCTKVSPGCAYCYAEARDKRHLFEPVCHWGKGAPRLRVKSFEVTARRLNRQAAGGKRLKVFPSTCDWLDPEVPVEWLAEFLRVIHETPNLDWLLLTKRPELWAERMDDAISHLMHLEPTEARDRNVAFLKEWRRGRPPANVWIGVSVEVWRGEQ